jgi:SAM-dependent methyltransferase
LAQSLQVRILSDFEFSDYKPPMRCETLSRLEAGRLLSPSAERNKGPVGEVLKHVLPDRGVVLEVGSGTGQHIVHFAQEAPQLTWQPSERDAECLQSIALWLAAEGPANVLAPFRLDVAEQPWPIASAAAVVSLNMIHIAPWDAGMALIRGAAAVLGPGAMLFLYGPFRRGATHTSPSNEAFDRQLRAQNPAWGVRDLEEVARYAAAHGFGPPETHEMPANNLSVVLRKREPQPLTD